MLVDWDMRKCDLCEKASISSTPVAKLATGANIQTDMLVKICTALECGIEDIMRVFPEPENNDADSATEKP